MNKAQQGFTLIELVVVIIIIGILSATALPQFMDMGTDARVASLRALQGSMESANTMVYSRAVTTNQLALNPGNVTVNGTPLATQFGFLQGAASFATVMNLSAEYSAVAGAVQLVAAPIPATCAVTYTPPAAARTNPTYTVVSGGC